MLTENAVKPSAVASIPGAVLTPPAARSSRTALQPVNPVQCANWDAQVVAHSKYSFFHGTSWAKTLAGAYGFLPTYFIEDEPGVLSTILPLMEVDSWLTGRRGVGLPFTDECGALYSDATPGRHLIQAALDFGKSRGWKSAEFRGGRELFPEAPAALSFLGHRINLEPDEEQLFARLESSARRAVRKAEKCGVTVTISQDMEAMKTFYDLQVKTRRKHGLPPQPFTFFHALQQNILSRDLGFIAIARFQGLPLAASVYFYLGAQAIYKYGASDDAFQQMRGPNLVMWEAIKWLARRGVRTLDLGRTSLGNEGLRRFKLGWGADEYRIEYVKYDFRRDAFVTERDQATGWHNRLFRAMPASVSRLIGAMLYRHWA